MKGQAAAVGHRPSNAMPWGSGQAGRRRNAPPPRWTAHKGRILHRCHRISFIHSFAPCVTPFLFGGWARGCAVLSSWWIRARWYGSTVHMWMKSVSVSRSCTHSHTPEFIPLPGHPWAPGTRPALNSSPHSVVTRRTC